MHRKRVLELGAGTGVAGVAAALLGASSVLLTGTVLTCTYCTGVVLCCVVLCCGFPPCCVNRVEYGVNLSHSTDNKDGGDA